MQILRQVLEVRIWVVKQLPSSWSRLLSVAYFCFVLCLVAETARSQVTWVNSDSKGNNEDSQCIYTGSGKIPLLCAAIAFAGLAVAMVVEHLFMLIAVTKATPPELVVWDPNSAYSKTITWQAGFFLCYNLDMFCCWGNIAVNWAKCGVRAFEELV
ncbi:hypothetical protein OIU74_018405 [Salix koriyanagi]|uniref:Uncharacterized protein n=1 Tax=Salix koriyanagi TaxID=2511006 RepID=A0A9Q0WSB5_9ROSI|nr:hypothetical protein OIU74_018405 [Salix koriyanagi]